MRGIKLVNLLPVILAALSISFFLAANADTIHLFKSPADQDQIVLSSAFLSRLPVSLIFGFCGIGVFWLLCAWTGSRFRGIPITEALNLDAPTYLPLAIGSLIPVRYIPGLANASDAAFLIFSTLAGPLLVVSLFISLHLKRRAFAEKTVADSSMSTGRFKLSSRLAGWLIFASLSCFLVLSIPPFMAHSVFGGDQPHYLVVTHSLLEDGDIYIGDEHREQVYRSFAPMYMRPQYFVPTIDGRIIPFHRIGLPVLAVVPYMLAGKLGALLLIGLMAALAATNVYWLTVKIVPDIRSSFESTLWVALTIPALPLSFMFFSEMPALLLTLISMNMIIGTRKDAPPRLPWLVPFIIWMLPWMHARDMVTALALSAFLIVRMKRQPAVATALAVVCAVLAMAIPLFNLYYYGSLSPVAEMGRQQGFAFNLGNIINGLGGLLLDQEFGIILYNPVLILALAGLIPLFKKKPGLTVWLIVIAGFSVGPNILYRMWWGGGSPPGRYYVAVFHLAAIPMAALLADKGWRRIRPLFYAGLACAVLIAAYLLINNTMLVNARDGSAFLLTAVSAGPYDAVEWWPSWIGDFERSWPLAALFMGFVGISVLLFHILKRKMGSLFAGTSLKAGAGGLLSLVYFITAICLYAPLARTISPGEPNGLEPRSHEADRQYLRRKRSSGFSFTDVAGNHEGAYPTLRFSADILFGRELQTRDDKAARGRSLPIDTEGRDIIIIGDEPIWAGNYNVLLGLRALDVDSAAQVEVHDLADPLALNPAARTSINLSIEFEEYSIPISLPDNTMGLRIVVKPSGACRFTFVVLRPLKLVSRGMWSESPGAFTLPGWRFENYTLFATEGAVHTMAGPRFWTVGDSEGKWIITTDQHVNSLTLDVRAQPGVNFSVKAGDTNYLMKFTSERRAQRISFGPELLQRTGNISFIELQVVTKGGFIPAEVDGDSEDSRHLGAFVKVDIR